MIIQCKSCSRKYLVKDKDIPNSGRVVKCGYCSVSWHQMPVLTPTKITRESNINNPIRKAKINKSPSLNKVKASDGKTYKFLGRQWAQLFPSGKTGLFAKKYIGEELNQLTGRNVKTTSERKIKRELDPSSENLGNKKQLPDIYNPKKGLGFFGYIFVLIIILFSLVGLLKTFENYLLNNIPEIAFIFELLDDQIEYFAETVKNMIIIIKDLINSY